MNVASLTLQQMFFQGKDTEEIMKGGKGTAMTTSPHTACTMASDYSNSFDNETDEIDQVCQGYEDESSDDDDDDMPRISNLYISQPNARVGISRPMYKVAASNDDYNTNLNVNPMFHRPAAVALNLSEKADPNDASALAYVDSADDEYSDYDDEEEEEQMQQEGENRNLVNLSKSYMISKKHSSPSELQGALISSATDLLQNQSVEQPLDNARFFSPTQGSKKIGRKKKDDSTPSKARQGLGISAPPKSPNSNRWLVPSVNPPSPDLFTVFILVIQATKRIYELIRVNYNPATATIQDLIKYMKDNITENRLQDQDYVGLCRPRGSNPSCRSITDLSMTASLMTRDGTDARIQCGEVLSAIPEGYTGKEIQLLTQHIMNLPAMKKLLRRSDPLSDMKKRTESEVMDQMELQSTLMLGIQQPKYNKTDGNQDDTDIVMNVGAYSSQIIFSTVSPVSSQSTNRSLGSYEKKGHSYTAGSHGLSNAKESYQPSPSCSTNGLNAHCFSHYMDSKMKQDKNSLSTTELENLKREAMLAARQAAEEAFLSKMEQLADCMKCTTDERAQLMEMSSEFAYSNPATPGSIPSKVHVFQQALSSPEMSILSTGSQSIPSTPLAIDIAGSMSYSTSTSKYFQSPMLKTIKDNSMFEATRIFQEQKNLVAGNTDKQNVKKKRWGIGGFRK